MGRPAAHAWPSARQPGAGSFVAVQRLVNKYPRWTATFETLRKNTGSGKKAIVGVARRLLCVMFAMLREGKSYRLAA